MFTGSTGPARKVSLRGRGDAAAETREQALERAQRERERRKRQKLEHSSATLIQVWPS